MEFGTGTDINWTLFEIPEFDLSSIGEFKAGDRIRFYAEKMPVPDTGQSFTSDDKKAWITVVIGSIKPYFIDQDFPNYDIEDGQVVYKSSGCLEVVLDEYAAQLLNAEFKSGNKKMQIQGRNFTLTKICVVSK